jgi:RND family efflux transporter MFP subunit
MKNLLWVSLLAASAAGTAGCHGGEAAATTGTPQAVQAQVVESRQQDIPVNLRSTGTVHSRETAVISSQVMGRIQQVLVREGDAVRAGQTLVTLDDAALRSQLDQVQAGVKAAEHAQAAAQTNAALATSTLDRYKQLELQKSVSPQEMDEVSRRAEAAAANLDGVRAQTAAARAQESGARTMLGYAHLVSPFAGVVTARTADPGTIAAPGIALLQVDQAGALQLQTAVDESAFSAIHKGMKVKVAFDGGATAGGAASSLAGTVAEIVPAADPSTHSFLVKIDLPSSNKTRAGTYRTAEFANGFRQAILIPRSAVVMRGSLSCVYVLDAQGIAELRNIMLGVGQGTFVEVLSGVSASEKLVDAPSDRDLAGKRIESGTGVRP